MDSDDALSARPSGVLLVASITVPGQSVQQRGRELCARREQVLTIVEDEQRAPVPEVVDDAIDRRLLWPLRYLETAGDELGQGGPVGDRREVAEAESVGEHVAGVVQRRLGGGLEGQPRLADTARPEQRGEPAFAELRGDSADVVGPPDRRRPQPRQPTRARVERADRRKLSGGELVHRLGGGEITEAVAAEEAPVDGRRELCHGGLGSEDLAAVADFHQPLATVRRWAVVPVIDAVRRPGVQGHPKRRRGGRPVSVANLVIDGEGDRSCRPGVVEHGEEPVTRVSVATTTGRLHERRPHVTERNDDVRGRLRGILPGTRRSDHVDHQEGLWSPVRGSVHDVGL